MSNVSLPTVLFLLFVVLLFVLYVILQWKIANAHKHYRIIAQIVDLTNQQEDVFNISSRVQGQGQWPTHDAHVSLDHFAITNEINNKYNDEPPTYEEAMSLALGGNINASSSNSVVAAVAPKVTAPVTTSATLTVTTTSTVTTATN